MITQIGEYSQIRLLLNIAHYQHDEVYMEHTQKGQIMRSKGLRLYKVNLIQKSR